MTAQTPAKPQKTAPGAQKPPQKRVSSKIRAALRFRVRNALTWDECAERAGLSPVGLWKARKRPEVQAVLEQEKKAYITEAENLEPIHKARALEVAREILDKGKSEAARARMVEFLRGGSKPAPSISVNLQQNFGGNGYAYMPPGATLVRLETEAGDSQTQGDPRQVIDVKAEPE